MPDFSQLTDRQREIYEFVRAKIHGHEYAPNVRETIRHLESPLDREKIEKRGFPPTVRQIGQAFKISSPNGVMCHLKALEKKGLIAREGFSARGIQLVDDEHSAAAGLPFLGMVAAGSPTPAVEQRERLEFNDLFGGPDRYVLRVRGQSMIEDHIDDGDYVVIRKQEAANNGERVVAMIDGEVTLKRFNRINDQVRLEPANGAMEPIIVDPESDARILGVLVGVLRKC
jgi:repressor LexA